MGESSAPFDRLLPLQASRPDGRERLTELLSAHCSRAVRTPDFEIDLLDGCARFPDGEEARFTPRQRQLLELFVRSAGRPVAAAALAVQLFGEDAPEEAHLVPLLVLQLRRKLEPDVQAPRYLRSLDAGTYLFDPMAGSCSPPIGSSPNAR